MIKGNYNQAAFNAFTFGAFRASGLATNLLPWNQMRAANLITVLPSLLLDHGTSKIKTDK